MRLRVMQAAEHILETGATVRACAAKYGVSKTTIHKDMRVRLPRLDADLSKEVDGILRKNLEERHIRGGAATREKYRKERPPPHYSIIVQLYFPQYRQDMKNPCRRFPGHGFHSNVYLFPALYALFTIA